MDASHIESRLRSLLAESAEGIVAAYLFGSVARGTARSTSDVDVRVLFEEAPPATLSSPVSRLEGALQRALGIPVQVVALNTAPVDLAIHVLRAECLLLDNDPSARIHFEVRLRNEYFDLEPHLRRYRKLEAQA